MIRAAAGWQAGTRGCPVFCTTVSMPLLLRNLERPRPGIRDDYYYYYYYYSLLTWLTCLVRSASTQPNTPGRALPCCTRQVWRHPLATWCQPGGWGGALALLYTLRLNRGEMIETLQRQGGVQSWGGGTELSTHCPRHFWRPAGLPTTLLSAAASLQPARLKQAAPSPKKHGLLGWYMSVHSGPL